MLFPVSKCKRWSEFNVLHGAGGGFLAASLTQAPRKPCPLAASNRKASVTPAHCECPIVSSHTFQKHLGQD